MDPLTLDTATTTT